LLLLLLRPCLLPLLLLWLLPVTLVLRAAATAVRFLPAATAAVGAAVAGRHVLILLCLL
jgi:hypothetical protein